MKSDTDRSLESILSRFAELPTDELIAETLIWTTDRTEKNMKAAVAASIGHSRGGLYLDAARSLVRQIELEVQEVSWRMEAAAVLEPQLRQKVNQLNQLPEDLVNEIEAFGKLKYAANYQMKNQEILWHFYMTSIDKSRHYMINSLRQIDPNFKLDPKTEWLFETIRQFRNHIEHRDKAIQNLDSKDWQTMSKSDHHKVSFGYEMIATNVIRFFTPDRKEEYREYKISISEDSFEAFAKIVQNLHSTIRGKCLSRLSSFFVSRPQSIPELSEIGTLVTESIGPRSD